MIDTTRKYVVIGTALSLGIVQTNNTTVRGMYQTIYDYLTANTTEPFETWYLRYYVESVSEIPYIPLAEWAART